MRVEPTRIEISSRGILEDYQSLEDELTIAVDGGTGDLMERFGGPAWKQLDNHVKCNWICLGRGDMKNSSDEQRIRERLEVIENAGLKYSRYVQRDDFFNRLANGLEYVDGVYLATPPSHHVSGGILSMYNGIATAWEKPLTVARLEALEHAKKLDTDFPGTMFPIDFFMTSKSLLWLLENPQGKAIFNQLGTIQKIEGECIERQLVEPHRAWLTQPEISGGGVGGIDCMVHPISMMEMILNKVGSTLSDAIIHGNDSSNVVMARYQDAPGTEDVETYMWTRAYVPTQDGQHIKLLIDAGKGTDKTFYGLKITGDNGELTIGCGTEFHPPFVYFNPRDNRETPIVATFLGGGVGYGATIYNFNRFIRDRNASITPDVQTLKDATRNSVRLVAEGYNFLREGKIKMQHTEAGTTPEVPEPIIISPDAGGLVPPLSIQGRQTVNK